jgi:hypothetical protein
MAELKRDPTKYLRDFCKSSYKKGTECRICGATEELQFHHYTTLSILVNKFLRGKKCDTVEEVEAFREEFKEQYLDEIYVKTVTLCKADHARLHKVYGKAPALGTADKQERWVEKQREKNGLV